MSATFYSIEKTCSVAGVAEALGDSSLQFEALTVIGIKSSGSNNSGLVFVRPAGSTSDAGPSTPDVPLHSQQHAGFEVRPGQTVTIPLPANVIANGSQFEVVADVAGEGVVVYYALSAGDAYSELETKIEVGLARLIEGISPSIASADIRTGLSEDEQSRNMIVCTVTGGSERIINTGLYDMQCKVTIKTHADQEDSNGSRISLNRHRMRTAYVRDLLSDPNTPQLIAGFVRHLGCIPNSIRDRRFSTSIEGMFYVSEVDFTITAAGDSVL